MQANPPIPPQERSPGRDGNTVLPEDGIIPPSTLRNMRQAHAGGAGCRPRRRLRSFVLPQDEIKSVLPQDDFKTVLLGDGFYSTLVPSPKRTVLTSSYRRTRLNPSYRRTHFV